MSRVEQVGRVTGMWDDAILPTKLETWTGLLILVRSVHTVNGTLGGGAFGAVQVRETLKQEWLEFVGEQRGNQRHLPGAKA